jgi:hypothetical protein
MSLRSGLTRANEVSNLHPIRHTPKLGLALLLAAPAAFACEEEVVYSEHLAVDSAANYYLVAIKRAHGDNLIGTIERSFGDVLAPGQTLSIQFAESGLADAVCPMDFSAGQTYLLRAHPAGGALQISRFNSHNIPADHERFQTYVHDIEARNSGSPPPL